MIKNKFKRMPNGTVLIYLTRGQVTTIDESDFDLVKNFKWYAHFSPRRANGGDYNAATSIPSNADQTTLLMHRLIMKAAKNQIVDHVDGYSLNNTKANLRFCTANQNQTNRRYLDKRNSTGFKGVNFVKSRNKYRANICVNKKLIFLGYFDSANEAAEQYDIAAKKYFGEFAATNSELNKQMSECRAGMKRLENRNS